MTSDTWSSVDRYVIDTLSESDPVLEAAQRAADSAGLPAISVSAAQGKFLHLLARIQGARRILEIGTLAGYSTIWLARALPPGGRLITLEFDPKHAEVARANLARAGLADRVEMRVGRAIDALPGARRRRSVRPDLHRRRQAEHDRLLSLGAQAVAAGHA